MPRPIVDTLREIRHGEMLDEATDKLAEVVSRVSLCGKPGELIIKLKVCPASKGSARTVVIVDDVIAKLPVPNREVTVFFPTADGTLQRNDPAQKNLDLRSVPSGVDLSTGEILVNA